MADVGGDGFGGRRPLGLLVNARKRKDGFMQLFLMAGVLMMSLWSLGEAPSPRPRRRRRRPPPRARRPLPPHAQLPGHAPSRGRRRRVRLPRVPPPPHLRRPPRPGSRRGGGPVGPSPASAFLFRDDAFVCSPVRPPRALCRQRTRNPR
ncbi:hypothetical protein PVAP13_4KG250600 [Panicum virgatum]|uniref:Uncharacterized protein n=1 Tax=Panicum virgatum TaxID=38727 RepID=A0A8T0TM99_PANVG|nr:hypothetical protein PVAP13_4KG250600 [Panicum virgatum]